MYMHMCLKSPGIANREIFNLFGYQSLLKYFIFQFPYYIELTCTAEFQCNYEFSSQSFYLMCPQRVTQRVDHPTREAETSHKVCEYFCQTQ